MKRTSNVLLKNNPFLLAGARTTTALHWAERDKMSQIQKQPGSSGITQKALPSHNLAIIAAIGLLFGATTFAPNDAQASTELTTAATHMDEISTRNQIARIQLPGGPMIIDGQTGELPDTDIQARDGNWDSGVSDPVNKIIKDLATSVIGKELIDRQIAEAQKFMDESGVVASGSISTQGADNLFKDEATTVAVDWMRGGAKPWTLVHGSSDMKIAGLIERGGAMLKSGSTPETNLVLVEQVTGGAIDGDMDLINT